MSKQISNLELAEIVGKLLDTSNHENLEEYEQFQNFMTAIATVVCDYCGGEIAGPADDFTGEWLIGIWGNDSLPEDEGIWKDYDPEGELFTVAD